MAWKSLHIFYYDNHDFLIREGIYPAILKNEIERFFFIRYWENGPHIRLRIKDLKEESFRNIKQDIYNFVNQNPSKKVIDESKYIKTALEYGKKEKNFTNNMGIVANNTVRDWKYEPEFEKYHGIDGVAIAEKEFVYSSKLSMLVLSSRPSNSEKYLFGAVFSLMILKDVLKNNYEISNFLSGYIQYWRKFSGINDQSFFKIEKQVAEYSISKKTFQIIKNFYDNHKLHLFHQVVFDDLKNIKDNPFKSFCYNFVHLFNNRLGMSPAEEIIISYMGKKLLGEIKYEEL